MFVDRYIIKNYSALHFVKVMLGFQLHFNRLNGVGTNRRRKTLDIQETMLIIL